MTFKKMMKARFLFVVQGEGRGHMTQAITLQNILLSAGHEVCTVLIGKNPNRQIPDFVKRQIKAPVIAFESPNFVMDGKMKSIKIIPSIINNVLKLGTFNISLRRIHSCIKDQNPDIIINFFDPLIGLYYLLYNPSIPLICIAHQYLYLHPGFEFPPGKIVERMSIKWYTRLTSARAIKKIALSFYPINDNDRYSIVAFPPLLRREVLELEVKAGKYLLVYLVNNGYMEDIIRWHKTNPNIELHCFTDKEDMEETWKYDDTLYFHRLDDKKFLQMMACAKGLVSTAGFESVCEAMYLGKPVFMVPVEGHFEQFCNARDAHRAGAGIYDSNFNISKFIQYLPSHKPTHNMFEGWVNSGEEKMLKLIDEILAPDLYAIPAIS